MSSGKEICKSEFLFSRDPDLLYEFIKVCASGAGVPRSVAIKTTAQLITRSVIHKPQVNGLQHHRRLLIQMIRLTQIIPI